jgi:hypothetical protein
MINTQPTWRIAMLDRYRDRISSAKVILLFGIIYIVSQIIIANILHPLDSRLFLKAQTTFSREIYLNLLQGWEQAGMMGRYRLHFYFDFIHPVWYSIFISALLAKGMNLNRWSSRFNILLLIPFIAGMMDLVENVFHALFISNYSTISDHHIFLSALASNTKWALALGSLIFALVLLGKQLIWKGDRK